MGDDFKPTPVPALLHLSDAERADQAAAEERRQTRLTKR